MSEQQPMLPGNGTIIPLNYPKYPTFSKLELLLNANSTALYSKLSPYSNYSTGILSWGNQPFVWTSIGNKSFPNTKYGSVGSSLKDVIRVSKFLVSGVGVQFLAKQFLLQTGAAFNERRIYNPLSPIVAAGRGATLGIVGRPDRSFDASGGLTGIASSLLGGLGSSIFGAPKTNPVAGTVLEKNNPGALPTATLTTGTKGLLRAGTANAGKTHLESAWGIKKPSVGFLKSLFANFIPASQSGINYRSDEGAYGLMIGAGEDKFGYDGNSRPILFNQIWLAGGKITRKGIRNTSPSRISNTPDGKSSYVTKIPSGGIPDTNIGSQAEVGIGGIDIVESTITSKPGIRYGDSVGTVIDEEFKASMVMLDYAKYVDKKNQYLTKKTDKKSIDSYNDEMKKVITELKSVSGNLYTINIPQESKVANNGDQPLNGYDRLWRGAFKNIPRTNIVDGIIQNYSKSKVVDDSLKRNSDQKSSRLPTNGKFDAINTLNVLPKDRNISNSKLKTWNTWKPYEDDQIAFFFYDVVNQRYIPFRATIKSVAESGAANWEELSFIGRADKLYTYGGFTRTLSLNFSVVISSLAELAPTWQRINYLTTLIKPANYTTNKDNNIETMNRFMVPPMVMLTLGDMYKEQPILIQTIGTTIPDDASWETQNTENMKTGWEYLASYMKSKEPLYGQLPRSIDISLTMYLLEKERAVAGGANFGHAPRDSNWDFIASKNISRLHESFVVPTVNSFVSPVAKKSTPSAASGVVILPAAIYSGNPPPNYDPATAPAPFPVSDSDD